MTAFTSSTKASEAIAHVASELAAAGIGDARLDARLLVQAASGMSREQLVLDPERPLGEVAARRLHDLTVRRLAREPVARILGERSFYGRMFEVTPATLDPRPDTETLIDLALEIATDEGWRTRPIEILDIGTGTGCILLTLLAELPNARGLGTDISSAALETAQRNAVRLDLARRTRWQHARSLEGVAGPFDLVISNPPYIPTPEIPGLDPEVRLYDPIGALDGGPGGLAIAAEIIAASAEPHGSLATWYAIEIGAGQAQAVLSTVKEHCGSACAGGARLRQDLGGHTRCVAWKPRI